MITIEWMAEGKNARGIIGLPPARLVPRGLMCMRVISGADLKGSGSALDLELFMRLC